MKFEEVLPSIKEGKKVYRIGWNTNSVLELCHNHCESDFEEEPFIFISDMILDDWEVEEEAKLSLWARFLNYWKNLDCEEGKKSESFNR